MKPKPVKIISGKTPDYEIFCRQLENCKALNYIDRYEFSQCNSIYQAYKKPSQEKISAYCEIQEEAQKMGAYSPVKILSRNIDKYVCAYPIRIDDDKSVLIIHTRDYRYCTEPFSLPIFNTILYDIQPPCQYIPL